LSEQQAVPTITVTIDGQSVIVPKGSTILDAANAAGISIPVICYHEKLSLLGACRMCLVEVEKMPKPVASCVTPANDGMVVTTKSQVLDKARGGMMEFVLINHPLECPYCDKAGQCELQDLTFEHGWSESRFRETKRRPGVNYDNPLLERDYNRCIHCKRCVRACSEIQGAHALNTTYRGCHTIVGESPSGKQSACEQCGSCLDVCPVGAINDRMFKFKARPWQVERTVNTTCTYCSVGCTLTMDVRDNQVVRVKPYENIGVNEGNFCIKGHFGFDAVHSSARFTKPLTKKVGRLSQSSWNDALDSAASALRDIKSKYGADSIGGIITSRASNEDAYLFQKFMRAVIGTNNVDSGARTGHAAVTAALEATLGIPASPSAVGDIALARTIFTIGDDIAATNPVAALKIKKAAFKNKAKLVCAHHSITSFDKHYAPTSLVYAPGTEVDLLKGLINIILSKGLEDKDVTAAHADWTAKVRESVKDAAAAAVSAKTGIAEATLTAAAEAIASSPRCAFVFSRGLAISGNGSAAVSLTAALALLTGNLGAKQGGLHAQGDKANEQGVCDAGALPDRLPGFGRVTEKADRDRFENAWRATLSGQPGLNAAAMIQAAHEGKIKALYIVGENPVFNWPDNAYVKEALSKLELLIVQDAFENETTALANVVFNTTIFSEKDGTYTSAERRVQRVNRVVPAAGEAKADWEIISLLAKQLGHSLNYQSAEQIFAEMASLVPSYQGLTYGAVRQSGQHWPFNADERKGKASLSLGDLKLGWGDTKTNGAAKLATSAEFPYLLMVDRTHYHSGTSTRHAEGILKAQGEARLRMNPADAEKMGIADEAKVAVKSSRGMVVASAKLDKRLAQGRVALTNHFAGAGAAALLDWKVDEHTGTPVMLGCPVAIERG